MSAKEWVASQVIHGARITAPILARRWNETHPLNGRATPAAILRILRELEREGRVTAKRFDMGRGSPYRWTRP